VPLDSIAPPLRIAVRGVGQVAISHLTVTNGPETIRAVRFHQKRITGRRAATQGLPDPGAQGDKPVLVQLSRRPSA